ncbi:hypothetical protein BEWA_017340 [Theileria equi strain WA]|uniref:Uncharacterized protein n=1 Tax=Theileria equi strain WA TaxID=1537102 RepID=L1LA07_THEEQ|nr:hypothetical protein BEWA_017340 [Theileria equi strain WA]EKX72055.1 hypothetical protein BEWA_017340 [Theileria equi strain WA]|eukprot:XP_004831507.1 hypothetical protein BEWA_017340 [Theileria equi strain WA]
MAEEVIIELKNKPPIDTTTYQASTSAGGGNVKITVERTTHPLGSDFLKYEHTLQTKGEFILKEIQDNGGKIDVIGLKDVPRVTSVSAYYWSHENGTQIPSKALLVQVTTTDPKVTKYYANRKNDGGGNEWVGLCQLSQPNLIPGGIERN